MVRLPLILRLCSHLAWLHVQIELEPIKAIHPSKVATRATTITDQKKVYPRDNERYKKQSSQKLQTTDTLIYQGKKETFVMYIAIHSTHHGLQINGIMNEH